MIGPIILKAKVYFTKGEEGLIGCADVGLPPGQPATVDSLHRAVGQAIEALPEGCRLLDENEFFNGVLIKEKTGQLGNFATPANFRYDIDTLVEASRSAYTPESQEDTAEDKSGPDGDDWMEEDG